MYTSHQIINLLNEPKRVDVSSPGAIPQSLSLGLHSACILKHGCPEQIGQGGRGEPFSTLCSALRTWHHEARCDCGSAHAAKRRAACGSRGTHSCCGKGAGEGICSGCFRPLRHDWILAARTHQHFMIFYIEFKIISWYRKPLFITGQNQIPPMQQLKKQAVSKDECKSVHETISPLQAMAGNVSKSQVHARHPHTHTSMPRRERVSHSCCRTQKGTKQDRQKRLTNPGLSRGKNSLSRGHVSWRFFMTGWTCRASLSSNSAAFIQSWECIPWP